MLTGTPASAALFEFGNDLNGLTGSATGEVTVEDFTINLLAHPDGAVLSEISQSGLAVDSRGIPAVGQLGDSRADMNLLRGEAPLAGTGESVQFSFDRPGVLTGLDFDGVKDEPYEYFELKLGDGPSAFFFDSFNGSTADPGLIDVPGTVVFLQEEPGNDAVDDRSPPLSYPFAAGEVFMLTYGELPVGDSGNGVRLQGLTVEEVPEPATFLLACFAPFAVPALSPRRL